MRFLLKILKVPAIFYQKRQETGILNIVEVGRFQAKNNQLYLPGQLFIHKVLAYRGMILFPWTVNITDYSSILEVDKERRNVPGEKTSGEEKKVLYYQVLIDAQDRAFISNFMSNEGVSFLGNAKSNYKIRVISGLDYVSHEDVLPYTATKTSFKHELLDNFFQHQQGKEPSFVAKDSLKAWQFKNTPWLKMSQVFIETTEDIRVTVIPFFIGYHKTQKTAKYWWRYCVRVENIGKICVQLRTHQWHIFFKYGLLDIVKGMGVVGQEPFLCKKLPCFQYCSHVCLPSSSGHMYGSYLIEREDGSSFQCRVPIFFLESKMDPQNTDTNTNNFYI